MFDIDRHVREWCAVISTEKISPSSLLDALIRIPSVSALTNRPLIELVEKALGERGWNFRELPYHDASGVEKVNLLATPPWQTADDFAVDLAFVCHTDTVPYSEQWKEAIAPQVIDEAMHGCGACDVKGFLACLLAALLTADKADFASTVVLVLTAEEEIGCVGSRQLLTANLLRPRHVVVGEPTSLRPARAGKGYGLAEIRVFGKEAHSAHPEQGVSAINRAAKLIGRIKQYALSIQEAPVRETARSSIRLIRHSTWASSRAERRKTLSQGNASFCWNGDRCPGSDWEKFLALSNKWFRICKRATRAFVTRMKVQREQPGFETVLNSPLVRRWTENQRAASDWRAFRNRSVR